MADVDPNESLIRQKVVQIYKFLRQLHLTRHPVPLRIGDQPYSASLVQSSEHPFIEYTPPSPEKSASESAFVLKVTRPDMPPAPTPPEAIVEWLVTDWETFRVDESLHVSELIDEGQVHYFADDRDRIRKFEEWRGGVNAWRTDLSLAVEATQRFESLYRLYNELQRDSEDYDLLVADGHLSWSRSGDDDLDHPILLKSVEIKFNPEVPEFLIVESGEATELYEALLGKAGVADPNFIADTRNDIIASDLHPLYGEQVDAFLQRFITRLHPQGRFQRERQSNPEKIPVVSRSPLLMTRRRTLDYGTAVDFVIDEIENGGEIPDFLRRIVDSSGSTTTEGDGSFSGGNTNGEDEHILLTKDANAEQLEIARRLELNGGVVVQGPPGTGKTHTIANLVGHLLASGQRILIASHTSKALEIVRDQIVEPLRPLCVSVLGADAQSRAEMEGAINAITGRLGSATATTQIMEEKSLSQERTRVLLELKDARAQLFAARQAEYTTIAIGDVRMSPSDAARYASAHEADDGWLPGPLAEGGAPPISALTAAKAYSVNAQISDADEKLLREVRPPSTILPIPQTFSQTCAMLLELSATDWSSDFWAASVDDGGAPEVEAAFDNLEKATAFVEGLQRWELAAVYAGMHGAGHLDAWLHLVNYVDQVADRANRDAGLIALHGPAIQSDLPECLKALEAIQQHIASAGRFPNGFTLVVHPKWRTALNACNVNGKHPSESAHIEALGAFGKLSLQRDELRRLWQAVLGESELSELAFPERFAVGSLARIRLLLEWFSAIHEPVMAQLIASGVQWPVVAAELAPQASEHGELLRLTRGLLDTLRQDAVFECKRRIVRDCRSLAAEFQRSAEPFKDASKTGADIYRALRTLDAIGYEPQYNELVRLEKLDSGFSDRASAIQKIRGFAPRWASALEDRSAGHDGHEIPGDFARAWLFRRLVDELAKRSRASIPAIQEQIEQRSARFREVTGKVAELRAWAHLVQNTNEGQQKALQRYKNAIKQFGSGKGMRAGRFARLAQQQMSISQGAVPAWVMPLSRVYTTYRAMNSFDVLIIDEASQADVYALLAMAFAKRVIVVGDDEQVTPEKPGSEIARVDKLIDTFLGGIEGKALFIEESSIFDFAKEAFGAPVVLTEHFRCVEPIIRFSNKLSYNGAIRPLRDSSAVAVRPATIEVYVPGGASSGQVNSAEGDVIASLICAMIEAPDYKDATFGVNALSGPKQALYIETVLRRRLDNQEIEARKIRCGMPPQFQGDQRTVMLLSVVDSPDERGMSRNPGYGPRDRTKKRYNVAASRARDQMWVCHSLDTGNLDPQDLRRRLILHARNPDSTELQKEEAAKRAESKFETLVQGRLIEAGYHVVPQYRVGAYRIDMLVTDGQRTLAVECDGDQYHTAETLEHDIARQMILERCGYRFERIRGSIFFRDPERALEPLFSRLRTLGIKAGAQPSEVDGANEQRPRDAIVMRASEIRAEWEASPYSEPTNSITRKVWGRQFSRRRVVEEADGARSKSDVASDIVQSTDESQGKPMFDFAAESVPGHHEGLNISKIASCASLAARITARGLRLIDNRSKGGSLWVIGGAEHAEFFQGIRQEGTSFVFKSEGGRATGGLPGWYTTSAG